MPAPTLRHRLIAAAGLGLGALLLAWLVRAETTERIDSFAACAAAGYPVAESDPPTCRTGGHVFVGPAAAPAPPAPALTNQSFELLVAGDSGGAYPARQDIITTPADWQRYWRDVHAGLATTPPLLPVDFATSQVVALSEGQKPTAGYNLTITGIATSPAGTTVYVTESIPTITCSVAQMVSNRYFVARTPRLTPPINFRITTNHHRC